jgi:hypothetical protein
MCSAISINFFADLTTVTIIVSKILLDFVHCLNHKVTTFRKLDSASVFRLKGGRGQRTYLLGTLVELAPTAGTGLTMYKVKNNFTHYKAPSPQTFILEQL